VAEVCGREMCLDFEDGLTALKCNVRGVKFTWLMP
jgi:hypothetical protein